MVETTRSFGARDVIARDTERTWAILQTGRLGDLWFTVPLADHLADVGKRVEVWYDSVYGNPFEFFPSVIPRPTKLSHYLPGESKAATIANAAAQQVALYAKMTALGRRVIWNQIYPLRIAAFFENRPYPEYWYRGYPSVTARRARTTLPIANDRTILYFAASLSLRIGVQSEYAPWLEANIATLQAHTGYRVLYVPPPGAPDHARFETWRGDQAAYQRLIARCGVVYGIITSAHVLGQLLGKPIVACYADPRKLIDTIGNETIRLFPGDRIEPGALHLITVQPGDPNIDAEITEDDR